MAYASAVVVVVVVVVGKYALQAQLVVCNEEETDKIV